MKKNIVLSIIMFFIILISYYLFLPAINIQSPGFIAYLIFLLVILEVMILLSRINNNVILLKKGKVDFSVKCLLPIAFSFIIIVVVIIVNFICSPLFNAKSYSQRIQIDQSGDFYNDFNEVDFNELPLLDRDSSEKLGDRVMGQMSDLVSQFYVSNQYTQINYNDKIVRVTPLDYAGFIKWISNRNSGVPGYITVNSVNGESSLIKIKNGMKYTPNAYFNDNLKRKLRFSYPTDIFGSEKFEIDDDGNPYWIIPTIKYTGFGLKTKVVGAILLDPISGNSNKYDINDVPKWVDNVFYADLIIEQVDDWGVYSGGYFNSIFGQKNVVNTTKGYNYLAKDGDIYLYTGITSVLSDESNLGFILTNMRTGKTIQYSVAGAEEYSAMSSAEGQVQQMGYKSTFPLLIKLNGKPTYMVSLKDAAGLVKMYGFIDVENYQKVSVTDSTMGIDKASEKYISSFENEVNEDKIVKSTIVVKEKNNVVIQGNTYYYILSESGEKYKISASLDDKIVFVKTGDKLNIGHYETKNEVIEIIKLY